MIYSISIPLLSDNDSKITHITSRYKGIRIVNLAFLKKICMGRDANLATSAKVVRDITQQGSRIRAFVTT